MYQRFFSFVESLSDADGVWNFEKPVGGWMTLSDYVVRIHNPPNRFTVGEIEQMSDDQLAIILLDVTFSHV